MKRMWMSIFKKEVEKYLKGTIVVKLETCFSHSSSEMEMVQIIIYNDFLKQAFIHNIGTVENVMCYDPIEVARPFISYYKGIIGIKLFKKG